MTDDGDEVSLSVPEMDCPSCAGKVEAALATVDGVADYEVRPTTGTVVVHETGDVDRDALVAAIEGAGYAVAGLDDDEPEPDTGVWRSSRARKTAISAVFLVAGVALEFLLPGLDAALLSGARLELSVGDALLLAAVAASGPVILRNGYYSAKNRSLDIDLLMSLAILAAVSVSPFVAGRNLFVEAASLAVLFNLAELLERYSIDRARDSLQELMALSPDTATVRRPAEAGDGEETVTVPVEDVAVGEVVVVEPGEKVPVDGAVVDGESAVDQSPITGESVPVDKAPGDEAFAGTINQQGYLEIEATAEAEETTLSRIVKQVEDAEANKTDRERFIDRFSGYYTPVVVAAAVLSATVPPLLFGAPWVPWFLNGIAFLVIACPCAFVISTPVSVVSAVTSAARNGVLIKGGDRLETMGDVDAVALDKTGTLTRGALRVTDVVALNAGGEDDLLRRAAAVERRSEHPIADAVAEAARAADTTEDLAVDAFEAHAGKGVAATVDGERHYAGTPAFFEERGFDLGHVHARPDGGVVEHVDADGCEREDCIDLLAATLPELEGEGKTVVLVGTDDELLGVLAVADEVRPESADAVARLRALGVEHVAMLTGDNEGTARAIAEGVGVDDYRAELLPDEKVAAVEELQEEYGTVAMVGDGINDAPALATADVGVAMGAAGTDTAIETADVALLGDDLAKLPYLYDLSHRAVGVIRQNVWGSLAVKALLALGIPLGYVTVVVAVLAGDVGMTVLVTGNAMRLSRVDP